jgi:hypothetical protein
MIIVAASVETGAMISPASKVKWSPENLVPVIAGQ